MDPNEILDEVVFTSIVATCLGHTVDAVLDVLAVFDHDDPRYGIIDRIYNWLSNQEDIELERLYQLIGGKRE